MNETIQLKLQAHLDGELTDREVRELESTLASDSSHADLLAELRQTRALLRENEPSFVVPETREFYWSKVQRAIEREGRAPLRRSMPWWSGAFMRWAGGAAACLVLAGSFFAFNTGNDSYAMNEIEGTGEDMGSITYQSDKDGITVVYLFDRSAFSK